MWIAFWLLAGTVALYFGAEWLVRGGAALALRLGMTPLLAGLTVVAYGTSSPELVVSLTAAAKGGGAIAIGNVVGSNIFNIGFILGLTALIAPLRVQSQLVRLDTPVMIAVAAVFIWCFRDGQVDRWEGALLTLGLVGYTTLNVFLARRVAGRGNTASDLPAPGGAWWKDAILIVGGLVVLVLGSRWFVRGAVDLARLAGLSEAVIGLTIVAAGTSLPELAASVVAAARKQADIALGNIVGSNIYNVLAILGVSGLVAGPLDGAGISRVDVWVMLGFSALLLPIAYTGHRLSRWEGGWLLVAYGGYLAWLWPK